MRRSSYVALGGGLVALSALLYAVNYAIFRDPRNVAFYTLLDLAFIPLEVLIVGIVINRLLSLRERRAMLDKLNMVIGAFFSEVGTGLLDSLAAFDSDAARLGPRLVFRQDWSEADWRGAVAAVSASDPAMDARLGRLGPLRDSLLGHRGFLLRLLENPNLLEHESFTALLWAVFHLAEELAVRDDLDRLGAADAAHVAGDMKRAYVLLLSEWLRYMRHLQTAYPYLFSLAVRTNPFDPGATAEVR